MILHTLLARPDSGPFLGFGAWEFGFRSLARPYGLTFLSRVILRHPWRTVTGMLSYRRLSRGATQGDGVMRLFIEPEERFVARLALEKSKVVVAVGFCQKPLVPPCPAGRPNHDCRYFDGLDLQSEVRGADPACAGCEVRRIGTLALHAGASMHIMTSAMDIARDVMLPSIEKRRFSSVIMCLCPYSVQAIAPPLIICGLQGYLLGYESGNCANWAQWLRADKGMKDELTMLGSAAEDKLASLLKGIAEVRATEGQEYVRYTREGNIYVPVPSNEASLQHPADSL